MLPCITFYTAQEMKALSTFCLITTEYHAAKLHISKYTTTLEVT